MRGQPPWFRNGERFVLLALVLETVVFSVLAPRFFTATNVVEVLRLSVELGLLAIALTPVIISGGIDLSVGAVLGLSAVMFGTAYHEWNLPVAAAALVALAVGAGAGLLNGLLIAKLDLPPLIVTLASLSLFRGIAEGMTHAAVNFTDFPSDFLFLGQGYLGGIVPAQLPILVAAACGCFVLLHRSVFGRALYTIGLTAGGARYAGIPVSRRVLPV
jgi:rhamnose transport system permease protein